MDFCPKDVRAWDVGVFTLRCLSEISRPRFQQGQAALTPIFANLPNWKPASPSTVAPVQGLVRTGPAYYLEGNFCEFA